VRESEAEGFGMLRRLFEEYLAGINRFDRPGEVLYGVFVEGSLVGVGGLNVDPFESAPGIGRVRRVYVSPAHRRGGVGRQLVSAILADAWSAGFCEVRLHTTNPEAVRFYERVGFRASPGETDMYNIVLPKADVPSGHR